MNDEYAKQIASIDKQVAIVGVTTSHIVDELKKMNGNVEKALEVSDQNSKDLIRVRATAVSQELVDHKIDGHKISCAGSDGPREATNTTKDVLAIVQQNWRGVGLLTGLLVIIFGLFDKVLNMMGGLIALVTGGQ